MVDPTAYFQEHGYYVARGMFSPAEVEAFIAHYMQLNAEQQRIRAMAEHTDDPTEPAAASDARPDPLKVYPRMLQMHRWDPTSLQFMLDSRIRDMLTRLLGAEPFAVQTMIYFKAPGARGQALHQDQYYLKVQPGTCMAAWLALDDCDEENGCLQVVDGSQNWDVLCTIPADTAQSFTDVTVPLPPGVKPTPVIMKGGDVLFFNGSLVHGSLPNRTTNRFRRSLIGHYIVGEARKVAEFYHPVLRMDGTVVELDISEGGSQCGIWVDRDGTPMMEMVAVAERMGPAHE